MNTRQNPANMSTRPRDRRALEGVSRMLLSQVFIFEGKAAYGSPSRNNTIPMTHKKKSISSPLAISFDASLYPRDAVFVKIKQKSALAIQFFY